MRKVLSLTFGAGVALLLFFLLLGCGGGRGAPTAIGPSVSSSQVPDIPQGAGNFVGVPYRPDGSVDASLQKQIAVVSSGSASETRVTISAEDVTELTNFTFELRYDPDLYDPVSVDYGEFMPSGDDLITFSYTDEPGVVSIAKVFIHPDEAIGVSGSGTLATVTFENRPYAGKTAAVLPSGAISDLVQDPAVVAPDMGVMWTTSFFHGDGNRDSMVNISDITPIAAHWNENTTENPEVAVVDYNEDTVIAISDLTPLAANFGASVGQFDVRVATDAVDGTYASDGTLDWADATGTSEGGFNEYHYTLTGDYSSFETIWVKVWFFDGESTPNEGPESLDYVEFYPGGTPPTPEISIVPGTGYGAIEIQIEHTTNTTGGDRDGTDLYAPEQGTPATGDVTANDEVTLRLTGIHYLYQGNAYGIGEAALYPDPVDYPDFNGETGYNNIIAVLQELLVADESTEFVSVEGDIEAFAEVPKQAGDKKYTGTIGPNAPSSVSGVTTLTANAYVTPPLSMTNGVEQTFFASVDLNVVEDGFAPEVWGSVPNEVAVNQELPEVQVAVDFGWDDWDPDDNPLGTAPEGEEYTAIPAAVQLVNKDADPWIVVEFSPAATANTPDPPTDPLTYTYWSPSDEDPPAPQRPGEPEDPGGAGTMATMHVLAYIPTGQVQGEYHWRIIETEQRGDPPADVQVRSSLKQPDEVFTVTGPVYLEITSFPLDDILPSEPSGFIYFFPTDPVVRLNPVGHEEYPASGTVWVPDDETRYNVMKKESGFEFVPQPFDMVNGLPESPAAYYVMGDSPPPDTTSGTHLGNVYLQPHSIGITPALIQMETLPGHVSIGFFDRQGNMIANITRNFVAAAGPGYRDTPVIDENTDFGVDVWDVPGPPDFSNKTAHKGDFDMVVFQVKNLWVRDRTHDNGALPGNSATHLILYTPPPELNPLPEIQVIPRVISTSPAVPCLVSIDPSEVYYWKDNTPHEIMNGQWWVSFRNAQAGESSYYQDFGLDPLTIAP